MKWTAWRFQPMFLHEAKPSHDLAEFVLGGIPLRLQLLAVATNASYDASQEEATFTWLLHLVAQFFPKASVSTHESLEAP